MSLENRISQVRGDPLKLSLSDGDHEYSSFEIYESDRDFGVSAEILEAQLRNWDNELSGVVMNSGSYEASQDALLELDELYGVSRSEIIRETLQWFYDGGVFEKLEVEVKFLDLDYEPIDQETEDSGKPEYYVKSGLPLAIFKSALVVGSLSSIGYFLLNP